MTIINNIFIINAKLIFTFNLTELSAGLSSATSSMSMLECLPWRDNEYCLSNSSRFPWNSLWITWVYINVEIIRIFISRFPGEIIPIYMDIETAVEGLFYDLILLTNSEACPLNERSSTEKCPNLIISNRWRVTCPISLSCWSLSALKKTFFFPYIYFIQKGDVSQ